MKHSTLLLTILIGVLSCDQPNESKQALNDDAKYMNSENELWTIYSRSDSIYHVKRLINIDSSHYLLTYQINASRPEVAKQTFIKKEVIPESELHNTITKDSGYNWIPFKTTPTLFVQLQPSAFKDEMAALYKRQKIEQLIDDELKSKNLGSWIAGDIGPGGANMLFEVQDIKKAKEVIHSILSKQGLNKSTIIARRIDIAEGNWFYEVIYPHDYSGLFVTM